MGQADDKRFLAGPRSGAFSSDGATRGDMADPLDALFACAPVGLGLWDDELRCLLLNDALAAINGRPAENQLGRSPGELLGLVGEQLEVQLREVLDTGRTLVDREITGEAAARAGHRRVWSATCYPVRSGDRTVGAGVVISDVTERTQTEAELRESEERFRLLVEGVTDYAIFMIDADGLIASWNTGAQHIKGYAADEIVGRPYARFFLEEDVRAGRPGRLLATAARQGRVEDEGWRVRKDGTRFWASAALTALFGPDGQLRGYSKVVRDLTQQHAAHEALLQSEATLRSLVQSAPDAVLVVDAQGLIVSVNQRGEEMFGYRAEELVGQPIEVLVPDHLRDVHCGYRDDYLQAPRTRPMGRGIDLAGRRKDGSEFPVEVGLGAAREFGEQLVTVIVTDITDRKRIQEQLAHQATHDALTGLPNRSLFMDRLAQALARAERNEPGRQNVAVLFFDLDRFKVVNDSLGHEAGDLVLSVIARRLRALLRPSDTVARFGGDEFAMLCEKLGEPQDSTRIARRILDALSEPVTLPQGEVVVSPSIGIALARGANSDPGTLLRDADAAMYRAKERGKARYELFDAALRAQVVQRLDVENELRRRLERRELALAYQPIVALEDRRLVGVEALARWDSSDGDHIPPGVFIPVAEETGLILPLGAWVLGEACRQAKRWHERLGDWLQVSVNLSARQLAHPDLVAVVEHALDTTGMPAQLLRLEITEDAVMGDANTSVAVLRRLSRLGVSLAIDDFGTGYSSLSRLRQFPVDALKVDRSFVDGLAEKSEDSAVVAAIVSIAHAYGITAIAEGVETEDQVRLLRRLGCKQGQGFHFGRAQRPDVVERLLQHSHR